jgi:ABC-2 type transport system ATP-binding protein
MDCQQYTEFVIFVQDRAWAESDYVQFGDPLGYTKAMRKVPVIELEHLTKRYPGSNVDALHDVSLTVGAGQIFGFLGPNGAGKTTTISMMVNLMRPTSGGIKLFGRDSQTYGLENRARIGFLAGDMALDRGLTGWQQLEYCGNLRGSFDKVYVRELAKRFDCSLNKKVKTLSRGNRQKVGLIAALMHKPDLLILDEPTSGLDPLIQAEFNKIALEHQRAGKTTFMSSHVLSEVQELCDQLAIIREGKVVTHKSLKDIVAAAPRIVRLTGSGSKHPAPLVKGLKGVDNLVRHDHSVSFSFTGDINDLLARLAKQQLRNVTIQNAELEDIFMSYYAASQEKTNA